ncbi:MAG: thioredoxin domain-containing protein [Leptonema sp. (in: Bacteria)]|nr:thioredoxin domain-containing protein [Leptonema sp. (in: bacteria)]
MRKLGLVFSLLIFSIGCSDRPYVEVKGRKLTEADLKREMPDRLKQLKDSVKRQYNSQLEQMLQELAHKRMIEAEAKKQGLEPSAYLDTIARTASAPSQDEIDSFFNQLKASGQIKGTEPNIKIDIANHLAQQKRESAIQAEISRLKKEYNYRLPPMDRVEVSIDGQPTRGGKDAKVTIVEFSDFECPYCIRAQKTTKELREKYGDKIKWVFKDFPLDFHPHAMGAHIAARCVFQVKQDAYWTFFDQIFDHSNGDKTVLEEPSLRKRALSLGVDATKYDSCVANPDTMGEVEDNQKEGQNVGVNGTPAFFINGRLLSGALPAQDFIEVIEEELAN